MSCVTLRASSGTADAAPYVGLARRAGSGRSSCLRQNVSRVPVSEARRLLESQGIVVSMPYRGMRLIEVSADGLRKILEVRLALETLAAFMLREACLEDPQILAPLDAISAELQVAAIERDRFGIADDRYPDSIAPSCS